MVQRSFTWIVFLVLLLLAGLLLMDWQDTLVNRVALIEVDNRSGQDLDGIKASWTGGSGNWPGVEDGQSALISVVVERPGEVTLSLAPLDTTISRRLAAGQRFYVRVLPEGVDASVRDDPTIKGAVQ